MCPGSCTRGGCCARTDAVPTEVLKANHVPHTHRLRRRADSIRGLSPASFVGAFTRISLVLVLATTGWAQAKDAFRPTAKPVVYDTGHETFDMIVTPSLYWLDNDRLLFAGVKAGDRRGRDARKLYIWDSRSNSVTLYSDAKGACVVNGVIRYTLRQDKEAGKTIVREGPLGYEREFEEALPSKEKISRERPIQSIFTCRSHFRSELVPPAPRFRRVVVLRNGDGYIDIEPGGGPNFLEERRATKKNLVLYQASGKAVELPLTWDEQFSPSDFKFSAFRNAYVLTPRAARGSPIGISGPWPKGRPLVVYLLWADGKLESVAIPYFWTPGLSSPSATKAGWIFGGGYFKDLGLYVFNGEGLSRIDVGSVKETAVSGDGCKAAVSIQNRAFEMGTPVNLKTFDLCSGGR
jgi:hypothetical protein